MRKFKDLPIRKKITRVYLPLAIIPMLLFALISTSMYRNSLINRSKVSMGDQNVLLTHRVEGLLADAESASTYLTISINNLINQLTSQGLSAKDVKYYNLISNELAYAKLIFKELDAIAFMDTSNRFYYSDRGMTNQIYWLFNSDMFRTLTQTSGQNVWFDMVSRPWLNKNPDIPVVTLGKKVWHINSGQTLGYLFINVSEQTLSRILDGQVAKYDLINEEGLVVSSSEKDRVLKQVVETHAFEGDHNKYHTDLIETSGLSQLISMNPISQLNWRLYGAADLEFYTSDFKNLLILTLMVLMSIVALDVVMSVVLNRLITKPIVLLKEGVEEIAKGRLDYRFDISSEDEIGLFAMRFNRMTERIEALVGAVADEEAQKHAYALALIQQQIKPHFLYNMLDIINKMVQMGQAKKAQVTIRRLADYYQHSLSGGADIITLGEELTLTKDYLALQEIRYSDILQARVQVPDDMLGLLIPKLTLQPLVENAIYHGLKLKNGGGSIEITGAFQEGKWRIYVTDDGVGISPKDLDDLKKGLEQPVVHHAVRLPEETIPHVGLKNVHHRLHLFFGHGYGLDLSSVLGEYTRVAISLKEVLYDQNHDRG